MSTNADPRIDDILDLISQWESGNLKARGTPSGRGDGLDKIITKLNGLARQSTSWQVARDQTEQRLDEFLDVLVAIASLNFTQKAAVGDEGDVFDALAVGLNALGEELQATAVSKIYLDNIITSMMDALIVASPEATIQTVNRAALKLLGYTEAGLIGRPIEMIFAAQAVEDIALDDLMTTGSSINVETICRAKDGRKIPVSLSASVMRDEQGQPQAIVCVARDITERRQTEELLQQSREQLKAQYKGFPIPTFTYQRQDDDFVLIDYNDAAEAVTHGGVVNFVGKPLRETIAHRPDLIDNIGRCFNEKRTFKQEIAYKIQSTDQDGYFVSTYVFVPPDLVMVHTEDITERKRAEDMLRASEIRYRQLFDSIGDAVMVYDLKGKFLDCNEGALRLLGYTRAEFLALQPADIVHPDFHELMCTNQQKLRSGANTMVESIHRRKDGGTVPVEINTCPITYQDAKVVLAVVRDISERKRAEVALQKNEALLAEAQRIARLGSWEYNLKTGREQWSDETYRILGFNPQQFEVMHEDLFNLVHPDDREFVRESIDNALAGVKPYDMDYRIILPDGAERIVHSKAEVIVDEYNQPLRMVGTLQDITEQKRAESALREAELRYRKLFEQSPDSIAIIDSEQLTFVEFNDAACQQLGYTREEFAQLRVFDIEAAETPEETRAHAQKLQREGQVRFETLHRTKQGERRNVIVTARLIKLVGKMFIQSIFRDITENKQAEEQLKASLHEKEVLLKEIHHRVKNNLQVISSLLDLQSGYVGDEHSRRLFQESRNRIKSMALVHERLYQTENLSKIDFAKYVESLTHYLLRAYGVGGVKLERHIAPVSVSIETAIPCGLIINELVSNALKHAFPPLLSSPRVRTEGKYEIWIELQAAEVPQPNEGQLLTLRVRDNGVGLPPEVDFRRTKSLGLTLVMTLVKQLKGIIELNNQAGAAFEITFTI